MALAQKSKKEKAADRFVKTKDWTETALEQEPNEFWNRFLNFGKQTFIVLVFIGKRTF